MTDEYVTVTPLVSTDLIEKVAEYYALAHTLTPHDSQQNYRRANQLSAELFMRLPAVTYRRLVKGLAGDVKELALVLVDMRGEGDGELTIDDILVHIPNYGKAIVAGKVKR